MRREGRGAPPGGGQLNGGSPTIPGGPGETGGEVPQQLMAQQDGGLPQQGPNHLEVIRMMMEEEARGLVQGDQGPLEQQMAGMPPIAPPIIAAPPQIPGMQGQPMQGQPGQGLAGMIPGAQQGIPGAQGLMGLLGGQQGPRRPPIG